MINSGITAGTPKRIRFNAGVYFKGATYDEKVAPTKEQIKAGLMGATQEGGTVTITPELFAPELDGAFVALKELQTKVGEKANMEASFAEFSAELAKNMVLGTMGNSTDGNFNVVTSSSDIQEDHFYSGFGFCGYHLDGRELIIIFKNALCTSGFTADSKNKTNSVFKGTFECMSDVEYSTTKLPYAIFVRKEEGWTAVDPDEVAEKEAS